MSPHLTRRIRDVPERTQLVAGHALGETGDECAHATIP
jgi:hypothetical protein